MTESLPTVDLQVQTATIDDSTYIVAARGEIDLYTAGDLWKVLEGLQAPHRRVVVDLSNVTFIDSTGLGVVVGATKLFRLNDGDVYVVTSPPAASSFDVAGLRTFLNVERSVVEALASAEAS